MDESVNRDMRNEHQRAAIAHEFRLSLAGQPVPALQAPPTTIYTDQVFSLHLFRRLNGYDFKSPAQSKKIEFLDRTGSLTLDGINVDLKEMDIKISSPAWQIHIPAENQTLKPDCIKSPSAKTDALNSERDSKRPKS